MCAAALFLWAIGSWMMANQARTAKQTGKERHSATPRRRGKEPSRALAALARRERAGAARLAAARAKFSSKRSAAALQRRRAQYLEIPKPAPSPPFPKAVVGTVALAFLLPLFLAFSASFPVSPHVARPHVARANSFAPHVARANSFAHHVARANSFTRHVNVARANSFTRHVNVARANSFAPQEAHASRVREHFAKPAQLARRFIASLLRLAFGSFSQPPVVGVHRPRPASKHEGARPTHAVALTNVPRQSLRLPGTPRSPWSLSPDGTWVSVVRAPATMRDPSFAVSTGQLIELERSAISPESATVTIGWARPVVVTISAAGLSLTKTLPAPDAGIDAFNAVAQGVGPHLIDVGWTPLGAATAVRGYEIFRTSGDGARPVLMATLPADKHSLRDDTVEAGARYRYTVVALTADDSIQAATQTVVTPPALVHESAQVMSGKGMFLYFSSLAGDARNFHRYDPEEVIAEAQRAGIHVIELRMARGACTMAETHEAQVWLNRLIDAAASAGLKLLAWTVPRRNTTQDLFETIAAAEYATPAGNGFAGLALDLEEGDHYMGDGAAARRAMVEYIRAVRRAVGPRYLIVATVASPNLGGSGLYPYAQIAQYADVLQPMEYWHYFDEAAHHDYHRSEVAQAAAQAVARTRRLAHRDIPVDVAGQSIDLEGTGAPSGQEILWSLHAAKSVGAIGETFFDWAGTQPDAWAAIQAFDW